MILGSLLEVMCLNEDAQSALRAKTRNMQAKDRTNAQSFVYNGTDADYMKKLRAVALPKHVKIVEKGLKKLPGAMGATGASYSPITNTYAVNGGRSDVVNKMKAVNPDGSVNMNSPLMQHERQHKLQFDYMNQLVGKGKNARTRANQFGKRFDASYPDLGKVSTDANELNKYYAHPLEYDANAAAKRGQVGFGAGTKRAVDTVLGRAQRPFKTTVDRGRYMTSAVMDKSSAEALKNNINQSRIYKKPVDQSIESNSVKEVDEKNIPPEILAMFQQQEKGQQYSPAEIAQINKFNRDRNKALAGKVPQQQPNANQQIQQSTNQPIKPNQAIVNRLREIRTNGNRLMSSGGVADRNTGIVYAKKNGKLVSNMMTDSQQK